MLGRGANAFIANDVRANVTQQSEGRKLCFQQALFLTSRHYAVGVPEIMPFGSTKEVVPKSACRRIRPFGPRRVRFENTWRVSESMIFGTPTTLQRIAASMLVQKTRLSRSPCCKPICTPLKCDRSICIFAAARFWQEFTRTTIVFCTSILSAIQSVTARLVKE